MSSRKKFHKPKDVFFTTKYGSCTKGLAEDVLTRAQYSKYRGSVDLILTSPPFPLNRKKKYGNLVGEEYLNWLEMQSLLLTDYLSDTGSVVIEIGNAWNRGSPTMSTLPIRALLAFLEKSGLHLCQQFIWFNPAKLPTPAPWVTRERIRVKDSFTNIWWMSKTDRPKASNINVLIEYSKKMETLLAKGEYNSGARPSNHNIGPKSFLKNHGGAIAPNVLVSANTDSQSKYLRYCRQQNLAPHPARMPLDLPVFFIKFLTDKGDLVMDPFAGSNTTGEAAEKLERQWLGIEANESYILGSMGRFEKEFIRS